MDLDQIKKYLDEQCTGCTADQYTVDVLNLQNDTCVPAPPPTASRKLERRRRNPRYVSPWRNDAGTWIRQYRRGGKKIRLPNGKNLDDAFWNAYDEAERQFLAGEVRQIGEKRTITGTIDAGLVALYKSTDFLSLAESSQRAMRQALERDLRKTYGSARLTHLRPKDIQQLVDEKAATTVTGARKLLAALHMFTKFCVRVELIATDPAVGVKGPRNKSAGYHTWTEPQISAFEAAHPIGSQARTSFALQLYTAQRPSDVKRMGWQHVGCDGLIRITQQKTGTSVAIPILPALQRVLDTLPKTNMTFLVNARGAPLTNYNGYWRKWVTEAGLPKECVPHGLRKSSLDRFAAAGCTAHQLKAISGHKTLSEVDRYTAKYDRELAAKQAVALLIAAKTGT